MEYKHYDLPLTRVRLFPLGDWHLGSRQCDERFVRKTIKLIEGDPEARWIGMGDLMENAIIGSKSDVYLQTTSPEDQIKTIVEMLMPIKDKCLFMLPGNHEERTMRMAGIHPDSVIAGRLLVPFYFYSVLFTLDLVEARTPRSFSVYCHHGSGGGYTAGGKVNAASKLRLIAPTVDATISGHCHTTSRTPVTWFEPGYKKLLKKIGYDYQIGSTLTWGKSYAEEKAKRPSTVEQICITFIGSTNGSTEYAGRRQLFDIVDFGQGGGTYEIDATE
jgi:hypothetical protein